MVARKGDAWETTQETAWSVMALTDWMVASGELNANYSYDVKLNDTALTQGTANADNLRDSVQLKVDVSQLLTDQANDLVISRTDGAGVLYYSEHLRVYLPVPQIAPLNRGIIVQREYTLPGSDQPITSAKVGDNVPVRLTIIARLCQ